MLDINSKVNWVIYYRDLLVRTVPEKSSSISQCILKGWLHGLGRNLHIDSMRLYLFDDRSNKTLEHQVYGDKEIWRHVDITRFRKEKTKYKKLFFVKIRHVRENGQFLVLGYLAFHTNVYVSEKFLLSLDILCMLYGNYIVKRLIAGRLERMNIILPRVYSIAAQDELPGTKVRKLLKYLHELAGFNYGIFCTVNDTSIVAEYKASNKGSTYLKKPRSWEVERSFIENIMQNNIDTWYKLSDIPSGIIQYVLFKDSRNPETFSVQLYPVKIDGELIALWLFAYSENNPYVDFGVNRILDGSLSLMRDSYRFLFQRRFINMIVNPIFQNRDTRINKDSVFVIMPFTQEWSNDVWTQVIKPAVQEIGMTPVRADDLYGQNIMEDVWQSILKAAIIICDTTGRNPNVFYELGIAHTLGKKVLLLTQSIDDIPFDLQAYRHIEYQVTISGGNQLKETIKKHIKEGLLST